MLLTSQPSSDPFDSHWGPADPAVGGASVGDAAFRDAVELANPACLRPLVLVCDHASNRVPRPLGDLGLPAAELGRHIAWDIGAAKVTRLLAARLQATAVLSRVSRLVIDCNRPLGHPGSICTESDGTLVPGNQDLDAAAQAGRAARYFRPYHAAVAGQLSRVEARHPASLVAIHSFTPAMGGVARPWQVGVLWNRDSRLAEPLIDRLRTVDGLSVGDNQPYSGRQLNYTVDRHGSDHGRPHVSIEIRQDQVADERGIRRWAELLAAALAPLLPAV